MSFYRIFRLSALIFSIILEPSGPCTPPHTINPSPNFLPLSATNATHLDSVLLQLCNLERKPQRPKLQQKLQKHPKPQLSTTKTAIPNQQDCGEMAHGIPISIAFCIDPVCHVGLMAYLGEYNWRRVWIILDLRDPHCGRIVITFHVGQCVATLANKFAGTLCASHPWVLAGKSASPGGEHPLRLEGASSLGH